MLRLLWEGFRVNLGRVPFKPSRSERFWSAFTLLETAISLKGQNVIGVADFVTVAGLECWVGPGIVHM